VWPPSGWIIRDVLAGTDYEITEAEDGEHALAAVAKQRPDLILMEIQLPSMDGYDQSTKFLFAINHQTARALGIEVRPDVLSIADEVIE
jgi:DNA-binding response OmpR family regulator